MTTKADFGEEELTRLKRGPFVAGMAISLADPGGPIELVKETSATLKTVRCSGRGWPRGAGRRARARGRRRHGQRKNPLHDFKPTKGALAGQSILDDLAEVNRMVSATATPEEAAAYREWLLSAAQEAANAAKEGGFMGFHAQRVSEGEQRMLDKLAEVLAPPA